MNAENQPVPPVPPEVPALGATPEPGEQAKGLEGKEARADSVNPPRQNALLQPPDDAALLAVLSNANTVIISALKRLGAPDDIFRALEDGDLEHVDWWINRER